MMMNRRDKTKEEKENEERENFCSFKPDITKYIYLMKINFK